RVARPAAVKVDVRRDQSARRRPRAVRLRGAGAVRGGEVAEQLGAQLVRLRAVDAADVRRRADRLASKLVDNLLLAVEKALIVEKVVPVQQLDHLVQLVGRKRLTGSLRVRFLNIGKRMPAVEMRGVPQVNKRLPVLLGGKRLAGPEQRMFFHNL